MSRSFRRSFAIAVSVLVPCALAAPAAHAADVTVTSFDGTQIVAHWFPVAGASADKPAPTVLMGPGWGSAGDENEASTGAPSVGTPGIATLHGAGYNVLTWDPRGFGKSGGMVQVDSPQFEGRDAQKLIDWVATQPQAALDKPGDPRLGMAGPSYGGGIQLVTAGLDHRVDAIVPSIAWSSLHSSLDKDQTPKTGWAGFLYGVAATRPLDPHIKSSYQQGLDTGVISADNERWFTDRGPGSLVGKIRAPTLLVQGTVDTLFTLHEAVVNYGILRRNHVPTAMLWFCGGHGACLTDQGDPNRAANATLRWLARYLKGGKGSTGPGFQGIDQRGKTFAAASYPPPAGKPLTATGHGKLDLLSTGGAGPAKIAPTAGGLGAIVSALTPAKAANAVAVRVRANRSARVVGAPTVRLTYRGKVAGPRLPRVFAQLVDDATGLVLGNQITPIPLTLDGKPHSVTRPLEIVSQAMGKGQSVSLQLVASTVAYATPRLGATVDFTNVQVRLPTVR